MLPVELMTPVELAQLVAQRARRQRLAREWTQQGLAQRAGVSLGSLKRFERTGEISLDSLLRIAVVLGASAEFERLFPEPPPRSLAEIERPKLRQRGRRT